MGGLRNTRLAACTTGKTLAPAQFNEQATNSLTAIRRLQACGNVPCPLGMRSYILVAAAGGQLNHVGAKEQPARLPRRLQGYPACCVEHSYWANGEVNGTTCYGGRSPWDAATMTDLCTAGYSEAGEVAPPFRDCRQEAIDSGNCEQNCAECDHNVGRYFANVGYASCPDWVVDAMNAEGAIGGQCAATLGYENACREWGYGTEGEPRWNVDEDCCGGGHLRPDGVIGLTPRCRPLLCRREHGECLPYEDDDAPLRRAHEADHCIVVTRRPTCMGKSLDEDGEDYGCAENACREWGYPKEGEWNVDEDCCAGKKQMACADGYRLENTGNVCYDEDCTAYDYHCIACDPASACMGNPR